MQLREQLNKFLAEKKTAPRPDMGEKGAPGTQFFAGYISGEEYNTKLQGQAGLKIYDEMRRSDGMIRATILAVTLPIRQAIWRIEPASNDAKDLEIAEFVSNNLFSGMSITWADFLRQALLHLWFGFMIFEQVYKVESGKVLLKKLAPRLPKTLYKWNVEEDMGLKSITQFVQKGQTFGHFDIPIEKLLIFTNEQEGANYEGLSLLRSAYKHWYIKNQLYKIDAIKHDRQGVGIPVIGMPENMTEARNPDAWKEAKAMGEGLRANERSYIITPFGYTVEMLKMGSTKSTDAIPSIQHHNEQIAVNMLAQFLTLGTTKTGSRALGDSFKSLFLLSLQAIAEYMEDTINRYCINPLVDYNFTTDRYPQLKASNIKEPDFTSMADAVSKLLKVGALTPDEEMENHIREVGKLPTKPEPEKQKTTERCTCGHTKRLAEGTYWRGLKEFEKCLNLREIDGRLDKAKEQLIGKIKDVQKDQVERLARDVAANPATAKTKKVGLLSSQIKGELLDIYRYGRSQVKAEFASQRKSPIRLAEERATAKTLKKAKLNPIRTPEEAQAFIESKSSLIASQMARRYENTALFAELEAQKLGLEKAATISFITDRLTELTDKEARITANYSVVEAFGIGRNVEAETRRDEIKTSYYSAILDTNVCEVCAPLDGIEHEYGDPDYETPNPNCLGGGQCRCLTVYVMKTEQEPSA